MIFGHWIVDENGNPRLTDLLTWADWFEKSENCIVKQDYIQGGEGTVTVSTVFLGIDHNFVDEGPPLLWETMVFGGKFDHYRDRCSGNKEQAEAMHDKMVAYVKNN